MKKLLTVLIVLLYASCFSQDVKNDDEKTRTKMEQFVSQSGVIIKFADINLSKLKAGNTVAETRIRKLNSGDNVKYFYQIEKPGQYGKSTASVEYSDLLEVIKAFNSLKLEVENDVNSNPDYLENKFITEDGFQLGYYVSKGKANWYIKLE